MGNLLAPLLEPFAFPFMVRALLAVLLIGIVSSTVGTFVVLRGMAFFGDALAHAILPGLAVGYLLGGGAAAFFWWGLGTAALTALAIGLITEQGEVKEDTAIGIVFTGMFALGVAMISSGGSYAVDLAHLLFGNILGVSTDQIWRIALFGLIILLTMAAFFKELVIVAFEPILAATLRLPTRALHYLQLLLIAATIVVSLQAVGVALMMALLITPPATASLLTTRLKPMMALAALVGAVSGILGLYLSYYLGIASGAAIVLVSTAFFILAFFFAPQRGWLWRQRRLIA
ncbi:MAG: metal ABC transporter permease [Ardenticatenales bacterium]|nr:metal ABC transporter permease [Ardenticatenales bacterium]